MKQIIEKILVAGVLLGATFLVGWAFLTGLEKSEVVRCKELQRQSVEYKPHFFLASWEDEMCRAHGIQIDAPIGSNYDKE